MSEKWNTTLSESGGRYENQIDQTLTRANFKQLINFKSRAIKSKYPPALYIGTSGQSNLIPS